MSTNIEEGAQPSVFKFSDIDWDDPLKTSKPGSAPPKELVAKAKRSGAVRKKIVRGEAGFFMNRSSLPPGFRIPPHSHNHDELIVILKGGCELDDGLGELSANDAIVLRAKYRYGFTCGSEGMEFLTIRMGEADTVASADSA